MADINQIFSKEALAGIQKAIDTMAKLNIQTEKMVQHAKALDQTLAKATGIKNANERQKTLNKSKSEASRIQRAYQNELKKTEVVHGAMNKALVKQKTANQQANAELKTSAKVALAAKGSYDQLNAQLQKDIRSFKAMSAEERKNSAEGKRLQKSIGDSQKKLKDLDKQMGNHQRNVGNYTSALGNLKGAFVALAGAAGIKKVIGLLTGSLDLWDAEAQAQKKLEVALGKTSNKLKSQASALQGKTRYGNEAIVGGQAFLAQMKLEEDQIERITPLILDFAAGYGYDLNSAFQLVAKTLGSSTNALSRYGIQIEGAAGSNERLESAMNALNGAFAGNAEAMADVAKGPMVQLSNAWGDLRERMGKAVSEAINPAIKWFTKLITVQDSHRDALIDEQGEVNLLVARLKDANTKEGDRLKILDKLKKIQPDIVEGIDKERINYNKLNENLRKYNELQIKRIALADTEKTLEEERTAAGESTSARLEKEAEITTEMIELLANTNKAAEEGKRGMDGFSEALTEIVNSGDPLTDKLQAIEDYITFQAIQVPGLSIRQRELADAYQEEADALDRVEKATQAYIDRQTQLFGVDGDPTNNGEEEGGGGGEEDGERVKVQELKRYQEKIEWAEEYARMEIDLEERKQEEIAAVKAKWDESDHERLEENIEMARYIAGSMVDLYTQAIDSQIQALEEQKQYELNLAVGSREEQQKIEEKYAKKEAELKRKKAVADKAAALIQATINTALAITAATTSGPGVGLALAIITAAFNAIQLGIIASQPVPQFAKGTKGSPEGPAIVGEKGSELLIGPRGDVQLSGSRAELRYLKKGTQVLPSHETDKILQAGSGYDSHEMMVLAGAINSGNEKLVNAIKNKREITIHARKGKITERQGQYFTEYLNAIIN